MVINWVIWGPRWLEFCMHLSIISTNILLSPKVFVFKEIKQFLRFLGGHKSAKILYIAIYGSEKLIIMQLSSLEFFSPAEEKLKLRPFTILKKTIFSITALYIAKQSRFFELQPFTYPKKVDFLNYSPLHILKKSIFLIAALYIPKKSRFL